jgi:hypothetical protein
MKFDRPAPSDRWQELFSAGSGSDSRCRAAGPDFLRVRRAQAAAVFVVILAISCYPLFSHKFLSIDDLLNHLSRAWILLHLKDMPAFRREYAPNWRALPDLALDIYAHILGRLLPLPWVGKSFVALTFAVLLGGAGAVHRAVYRKWSLWPFTAALFLYNRILIAGEVNFLFAVGLYLHVTALWIRLRERPWPWRVGMAGAGAIAIFFAHLFPVGLLGVTLGGYEIGRGLQRRLRLAEIARDGLLVGLPFVVPAIIALIWTPHSATSFVITYHGIRERLLAFDTPLLYHPLIEAGGFAALLGILAWLAWRGAVRVDPGLAAALSLLFLVQLAMPFGLFTAVGADYRIPVPWAILAVGAIDVVAGTRRVANLVIAAVVLLFCGRFAILEASWASNGPIYADINEGLRKLPPGAIVALGFPPGAFQSGIRPTVATLFLPTWEIARHGGFTQTVFAIPTQHPLIMRPRYARLAASAPAYLVWRGFERAAACAPAAAKMKPPRSWARFNAFVILFPDLRCLHPIRPMTLLYRSPAVAVYGSRREHREKANAAGRAEGRTAR